MGTAFATARDVLFRNQDGSEDGTFLPAAGGSIPVRITMVTVDDVISTGPVGLRNPGYKIRIDATALPARPIPGTGADADRILARGITHRITDVAADPLGLWVTCDVDPIP